MNTWLLSFGLDKPAIKARGRRHYGGLHATENDKLDSKERQLLLEEIKNMVKAGVISPVSAYNDLKTAGKLPLTLRGAMEMHYFRTIFYKVFKRVKGAGKPRKGQLAVEMWNAGKSIEDIQKVTGCTSRHNVLAILRRKGVRNVDRAPLKREIAVAMWNEGKSLTEIVGVIGGCRGYTVTMLRLAGAVEKGEIKKGVERKCLEKI